MYHIQKIIQPKAQKWRARKNTCTYIVHSSLIGEPVYETIFVSMQAENVMIKQNEIDAILAFLERKTQWAVAWLATGHSAGVLFVIGKGGRGSAYATQRSVAPFITELTRDEN